MSNDDSLSLLHHPAALPRLVDRGLLTEAERKTLVEGGAPERQRHNVVLGWICARFAKAVDDGVLLGGAGFEQEFLAQACLRRAKMGTLPDERVDRMPLAYMHIVQVLVACLRALADRALPQGAIALLSDPATPELSHLSRVRELSIFLWRLALFYRGFLSLSKSFLDPFGNSGSRRRTSTPTSSSPSRTRARRGGPARRARAGVTREIGAYGLWGGCAVPMAIRQGGKVF